MDNKRKLLSCHIINQINKSTFYYLCSLLIRSCVPTGNQNATLVRMSKIFRYMSGPKEDFNAGSLEITV